MSACEPSLQDPSQAHDRQPRPTITACRKKSRPRDMTDSSCVWQYSSFRGRVLAGYGDSLSTCFCEDVRIKQPSNPQNPTFTPPHGTFLISAVRSAQSIGRLGLDGEGLRAGRVGEVGGVEEDWFGDGGRSLLGDLTVGGGCLSMSCTLWLWSCEDVRGGVGVGG